MSSRNEIFAALDDVRLAKADMPEINVSVPERDLAEQYAESLPKVGGTLIQVKTLEEVQAYLDKDIAEGNTVISMVDGLKGNRELDASPYDLHDLDFALIPAEFAVAENGAVYVRDSKTGHRVLPFITENLAAVVSRDNIYANMHEAVKHTVLEPGELGSYIAGPSKTADIEQALVIGAHGACSMTVYMVG